MHNVVLQAPPAAWIDPPVALNGNPGNDAAAAELLASALTRPAFTFMQDETLDANAINFLCQLAASNDGYLFDPAIARYRLPPPYGFTLPAIPMNFVYRDLHGAALPAIPAPVRVTAQVMRQVVAHIATLRGERRSCLAGFYMALSCCGGMWGENIFGPDPRRRRLVITAFLESANAFGVPRPQDSNYLL